MLVFEFCWFVLQRALFARWRTVILVLAVDERRISYRKTQKKKNRSGHSSAAFSARTRWLLHFPHPSALNIGKDPRSPSFSEGRMGWRSHWFSYFLIHTGKDWDLLGQLRFFSWLECPLYRVSALNKDQTNLPRKRYIVWHHTVTSMTHLYRLVGVADVYNYLLLSLNTEHWLNTDWWI